MSSDFPRFPIRLLIKFPAGFHARKPPILHSFQKHSIEFVLAKERVTSLCDLRCTISITLDNLFPGSFPQERGWLCETSTLQPASHILEAEKGG